MIPSLTKCQIGYMELKSLKSGRRKEELWTGDDKGTDFPFQWKGLIFLTLQYILQEKQVKNSLCRSHLI